MSLKSVNLVACLVALVACSGCSTWNNKKTNSKESPWSITKLWKKEYQQPQSLAAIWTADVLTVPGQPPTRGFGGRIYFYNERSQAIPVDGDLMVHGYQAPQGARPGRRQSDKVEADKTFAFTAEQLTTHFSPSEMGASYSIWVPWDAADGLRQEITLIPTFKGKDGSLVQGAPAKVNLPGRSADGSEELPNPMQTVSYRQSSMPTNPGIELPQASAKMRTTTINVPPAATIGKPRSVESYTLGAGSNALTSGPASSGVMVGGANASAEVKPAATQTDPKSLKLPPVDTSNLQQLTPPPAGPDSRTLPTTKPFQMTPWNHRLNQARGAPGETQAG